MMMSVAKTAAPVQDETPVYDATSLTQDGDIARIRLGSQVYTLRITRAGKLILTK